MPYHAFQLFLSINRITAGVFKLDFTSILEWHGRHNSTNKPLLRRRVEEGSPGGECGVSQGQLLGLVPHERVSLWRALRPVSLFDAEG